MTHPLTLTFAVALAIGLARLAWEVWSDLR